MKLRNLLALCVIVATSCLAGHSRNIPPLGSLANPYRFATQAGLEKACKKRKPFSGWVVIRERGSLTYLENSKAKFPSDESYDLTLHAGCAIL